MDPVKTKKYRRELFGSISFFPVVDGGRPGCGPVPAVGKDAGLDLTPENLAFLVLAMAKSQHNTEGEELSQDRWIRWCLAEGWAVWEGQGSQKNII